MLRDEAAAKDMVADKPSARQVLEMFRIDSPSNQSYLDRLMRSSEVDESIMPRTGSFSSLGAKSRRDVSNLVACIAIEVAHVLAPQDDDDDEKELIEAVLTSNAFLQWG